MNTKLTMIAAMLPALVLTACSGKKTSSEVEHQEAQSNTLILYYSQTGTTKEVAETLQSLLKADIEEIAAEEPYSGSYSETISRVQKEREQGVTAKVKPLAHTPKDYDIVFLGYPVWFGTYAPPIAGLLETADFNGVKIVPFCTFGSGGLESSAENLKNQLPGATVAEGYGVRAARISKMPEELKRFLTEQGYIQGEVAPLPDFSSPEPVTAAQTAIFDAACGDYQFPLGTPVDYRHRAIPQGTEYMFTTKGEGPDGKASTSTIYVIDDGQKPEFTKVVR